MHGQGKGQASAHPSPSHDPIEATTLSIVQPVMILATTLSIPSYPGSAPEGQEGQDRECYSYTLNNLPSSVDSARRVT